MLPERGIKRVRGVSQREKTCDWLSGGRTREIQKLKRASSPLCVNNAESQVKGNGASVGMKTLKQAVLSVMAFAVTARV
jgi:hypothetical protein